MKRLQALLDEGLGLGLYLGASCAVYRQGEGIIGAGLAGLAQEDPDRPVTEETVWDLASLTKPLATATSVLILAQEGALTLEDEIGRFLPDGKKSLGGITLRHCLTHTTGLRPWTKFHSRGLTRDEVAAAVLASERERPPLTGYAYSDLGYILLGEVVGKVTGQPVSAFARERIFSPLEMTSTCYLPPGEWCSRIAATRCPDRDRVLVGEVHDGNCHTMNGIAGHAGLFGTVGDALTYARMLLNEGELEGTRILSPLAARQMMRNQNPAHLRGHTIGWFTRPNPMLPAGDFLPEDAFGHTGFTGTSLVFVPSLGLAVALFTNRVYQQRDAAEFLRFRRRFHNAVAGLLT